MAGPAAAGIDYDEVTRRLERDGLASFAASYDAPIAGVVENRRRLQRLYDDPR